MSETIRTKIVGVTFNNDDGTNRQEIIAALSIGDSLHLVDRSSEKYPEAIGVFNEFDEQCGNLNKTLALDLRATEKDFTAFDVTVLEITGGDGRNYGCNIEINTDTSYDCTITIGDGGSFTITTPLINTDEINLDGSRRAEIIKSLSIKDTLRLADTSSPDDPNLISVYPISNSICGDLPPFACEQLRKRDPDFLSFTATVLNIRDDKNGVPYCQVFLLKPSRRRASTACQNDNSNTPPTSPVQEPFFEPKPTPSPKPDSPISTSGASSEKRTPVEEKKNSGVFWLISACAVILLVLYFVFFK